MLNANANRPRSSTSTTLLSSTSPAGRAKVTPDTSPPDASAETFFASHFAPELLQALRVITRGDALLSPAVTRRLISEFVARPPDAIAAAGMESLTNREREVVALVAHGLSNDEIAEAMVLSPTTAKTHVSRAMIKLGARDRAQLVVFAYQAGLVTPRAAR